MRCLSLIACALALGCSNASPISTVPQTDKVISPSLKATVDVVRDEQGIPHIYGSSLADVAFAEGYLQGVDRLVQMDLVRHFAAGRLSEIAGDLSPTVIDGDIRMRVHHLEKTAMDELAALKGSSDPDDQELTATLTAFAAGVNAYAADLQAGRYTLPPQLSFAYDPSTFRPWTESDSILVGELIAFQLSFTGDSDLYRTQIETAVASRFTNSGRPELVARSGLAKDVLDPTPADPTYTLPGGFAGLGPIASVVGERPFLDGDALALLDADRGSVRGLGNDRVGAPMKGSNNWVIGPKLTDTGHVYVANDPHLGLQNPATFWLVHLSVSGSKPVEVMGAQFPGAPGVILGHNRHVAWGATTSNLDVTDVYREQVVACDGAPQGAPPCVMFQGTKVPLQARVENFDIGRFGHIVRTQQVTLYDVPHHGPILPRVTPDHSVEALGSQELSVRWTGHEPTPLLNAVYALDKSSSVKEAAQGLQKYFKVGGENWVLGDDQGHFGWTAAVRVPRRPAGTQPWKVLPGDGSAEWLSDLDLKWVPHAFDPDQGFLATANADPIGVTDSGDPFAGQMLVDGIPLYIGSDFDPGTRVGRIVKRIQEIMKTRKLNVADLQAIQADDVSEWDQLLLPTLMDAAKALEEEINKPGTHPELSQLAMIIDPPSKAILPQAIDILGKWSGDTPTDSVAATLASVWVTRFALLTFEDETDELAMTFNTDDELKLLVKMCLHPEKLASGLSSAGDALYFDDTNTTNVVEGKRLIAAMAITDMTSYLVPVLGTDVTKWSWGRIHTLTLAGLLPIDALQLPQKGDPMFPNGYPRHGDNGTVDVGQHGLAVDNFTYAHGPNIRAVYDLDPAGPKVKNVLPGGEKLDPTSPHYDDLLQLWLKNATFDQVYVAADVTAAAKRELAAHGDGRVRFQPK